MVAKEKIAIGAGLAGWCLMLLWSVVSYRSIDVTCGVAGRLNMLSISWSLLFYPLLMICFAVSALFAYKLISANHAEALKEKWLWGLGSVFLMLALVTPSLNTHDSSFYFSAGKAFSHGINVFAENWRMINMYDCHAAKIDMNGIMYGPIAVWFFGLVFNLSQGNFLIFVFIWKLLMLLCFFILILTSWKIVCLLPSVNKQRVEKWKFYFLWCAQPLLVWQWVGNGQFDVLWEVFVFLAIWSALKKYWWLVIVLLTIGIWIKFIPLLMAPWFVLWWWQDIDRSNWKKKFIQAMAGMVTVGALTCLVWKPVWAGTKIFTPIILQTKWAVNSFFSVLYYSLKPLFVVFFAEDAHWWLTRLLQGVLLMVALYLAYPLIKKLILGLLKHRSWQTHEYVTAVFVSMLIYLSVWQKSFWPWYISWLLPFGLLSFYLSPSIFLKRILIWISVVPVLSFYIPWIYNHILRSTDAPSELWFQYVVVISVWVYPLAQLYKWRKISYSPEKN